MPAVGILLTAVAVRHPSAEDVADVVAGVLRDAGRRAEVLPAGPTVSDGDGYDVLVGPATDGWVTVHPHYGVPTDGLAVALTRRLDTIASATGIYEDVLWRHDLVDRGRVLDRYVNLPEYFGPGEYGPEHAGDPHLVASVLGADPQVVEPYFRQVSVRRARSRLLPPPKAHASDTFHLLDGWVVTDLWRRMGISWGGDHPVARVAIGADGNEALCEHLSRIVRG